MTSLGGPTKVIPALLAALGEVGRLGDESPADPDRVGAGLLERRHQPVQVQVAALPVAVIVDERGGPERYRLARLSDEP